MPAVARRRVARGRLLSRYDLADAKRFIKIENIPIFDVHSHPQKGDVDLDLLKLIVRNSRRRADAGNFARIMPGHTSDDDIDEGRQPETVGFADGFRIARYSGRPCIYCDFYLDKNKADHALTFPYRSVERMRSESNPDYNYIDGISLLRRPPERDLGVLTHYGRQPDQPADAEVIRYHRQFPRIRYATQDEGMNMDLGAGTAAPAANMVSMEMLQTVLTAFADVVVTKLLEKFDVGGAEPPPMGGESAIDEADADLEEIGDEVEEDEAALGDEDADGIPDDEEAMGEGGETDELPPEPEAEEEYGMDDDDDTEDEQYDMGGAAPSGTNTFTPDAGRKRRRERMGRANPPGEEIDMGTTTKPRGTADGKPTRADSDATRLRRDQERITVSRYKRDLAARDERIQRLETELVKSKREGELKQLLAEGYEFDLAETLGEVVGMNIERYQKELKKITTNYRQNPVGQPLIPADDTERRQALDADGEPEFVITPEIKDQIIRYAREKNLAGPDGWDRAVKKVRERLTKKAAEKKAAKVGANGQ